MRFTNEEMVDMILIYGECRKNARAAQQLYAERFPNRQHPSHQSFINTTERLLNTGSLSARQRLRGRSVTHEGAEVAVLAAVALNPHASSRDLERQIGISRTSALRILHRHKYHPFHISLHQELHGNDFQHRMEYCQWVLQHGHVFPRYVLFTDEATFTNHGHVNLHNMHYWATENPHWLREVEHQRQWSVNVWCGIIGHHIIGPYFMDGRLNGREYTRFLRRDLPALLENVELNTRQMMWYQHDGCPAHYALIARNALDNLFPNRWIGRGSPLHTYPARSPDLTPLDFFLWGHLKM